MLLTMLATLACGQAAVPPAHWLPRGCRDRSCWTRVGGRGAGALVPSDNPDAGSPILNGWLIGAAFQCDAGTTVLTEAPIQSIGATRASNAYCTKQDGTLVLMPNDSARLEQQGLLSEEASTNDVTAPRDCTDVSWVKTSVTCTHTTGADGVTSSGSLVTASGANGTALTTVTKLATLRSSSMRIKRVFGSGAVSVARDGATYTDISASLSSSTWKWVRHGCGGFGATGSGADPDFAAIPNCIDVSNFSGSVLNPVIGLKLATSGDSVAIDFVQDEAHEWATSPMAGFARVKDQFAIALDGGLPAAQGELSVDFSVAYTTTDPAALTATLVDTGLTATRDGVTIYTDGNTGQTVGWLWNGGGVSQVSSFSGYPVLPGNAHNYRLTWGGTNEALWADGTITNSRADATAPSTHRSYTVAENLGGGQLDGWLTRVRWTAGAYSSFHGSSKLLALFGDSIVFGSFSSEGHHPPQLMSKLLGGRARDVYVSNDATSGYTIDQCRTLWDASAASVPGKAWADRSYFIFQCGTNSAADGVASVYGKILAAKMIADDAGVPTVFSTITPFVTNQNFIYGVNQAMRAQWADAGWPLADTEHALEYPPDSGILNPIYDIGDHEHGNDLMAAAEVNVWFNVGRDAGYW